MATGTQTTLSTLDLISFLVDDTLLSQLKIEPMYPSFTEVKQTFKPVRIGQSLYPITAERYGGKAESLYKLVKEGFSVPPAWAIPCEQAFKRPIIDLSGMPDYYTYAVRSGAPISMPGLLQTKLNVEWADIQAAVEAVWDSWNSEHAKLYRKAKGISDDMGTGVIIQKMVDVSIAGVAFTSDPNKPEDGNDFNPIIEYVEGLGEQLVSGAVQPTRADGNEDFYEILHSQLETIHEQWGPSDVEWCWSDNETLYFVQQRKLKFSEGTSKVVVEDGIDRELIRRGKPVGSPKKATLRVCLHKDLFNDGDALYVAEFAPEYYPLMMRAGAILCQTGGETCHAAIIAREIGVIAISNIQHGDLTHGMKVVLSGVSGAIYKATEDDVLDVVMAEKALTVIPPERPDMDLLNKYWDVNLLLTRFYTALDKHKKGVIDTPERDAVVREIAKILGTYFYTISLCEIRHMRWKIKNAVIDSNHPIVKGLQLRGCRVPLHEAVDRVEFKKKGVPQPHSVKRTVELLELAVQGYNDYTWNASFGGTKWGKIAQLALSYYKGELSDILFIDACFNLQHNGGRAFNKFNEMYADDYVLKKLLDARAKSYSTLMAKASGFNYRVKLESFLAQDRLLEAQLDLPDVEEPLLNEAARWGNELNLEKTYGGSSMTKFSKKSQHCDCPSCTAQLAEEEEEDPSYHEDDDEGENDDSEVF